MVTTVLRTLLKYSFGLVTEVSSGKTGFLIMAWTGLIRLIIFYSPILVNIWLRSKMLSRPRRLVRRDARPMAITMTVRPRMLWVSFFLDSSSLALSPSAAM